MESRRCSAFRDLRYDKAVFLQDGACPCREGLFAAAEEEEPLAVEHPADGLFRGDDPVGKDQDLRLHRQGQRCVDTGHGVVSGMADDSLERLDIVAELFRGQKAVVRPGLADQGL